MITKTYLFANKHPTAGLAFSWWEGAQQVWGFWSWGESGRFILRHLIKKYWKSEWIIIYNKYNQALLEIKDSWMIWEDSNWNPKKIWCIVLYQNIPNENDNNVPIDEQWSEWID